MKPILTKLLNISVLLVIGLTMLTGCSKEEGCMDPDAVNYNDKAKKDCCCQYTVTYSISGSSNFYDVTYTNSSGGATTQAAITNSWTHTITAMRGTNVSLRARSKNNSGSVTVIIKRGGTLFKSATSSGAYVTAITSGDL